MHYQLGQDVASIAKTYSVDELKNISAYTHIRTQVSDNPKKYFSYGPGTPEYHLYPWNWIDLPRNHLENTGIASVFDAKSGRTIASAKIGLAIITSGFSLLTSGVHSTGKTGVDWTGRAFLFKDPFIYLNGLQYQLTPAEYIRYLKLAPLAGFNITGTTPVTSRYRDYEHRNDKTEWLSTLPPAATADWWMEVVTWYVLQNSFTMLRMAQIEDKYDLEAAYMNSGKLIDALKADMRSEEPVDVVSPDFEPELNRGFRISLALQPWEITALENGINTVRALIDESRKKMAVREIELSNVDATIVPTSFSTDPLQNPYLVYDTQKSTAAGQPIFTNIARNLTANWNPPEVAGAPEQQQYWEQVSAYTAEHERDLATAYGPASQADINKYGLETKKTNWLPWLLAGGAAAFAASQMM